MVLIGQNTFCRNIFVFLLTVSCALLLAVSAQSQETDSRFHMKLKNRLLTITAMDADVKNILSEISESTGIDVSYSGSIEKQVTTKMVRVPLSEALGRLLSGLNYTIIYSYLEKKDRFLVSEIYVLPKYKGRSFVRRSRNNIDQRISSYERKIKSLTERIEKLNPDDRRIQSYERRLRSYQKSLDRLRQQR